MPCSLLCSAVFLLWRAACCSACAAQPSPELHPTYHLLPVHLFSLSSSPFSTLRSLKIQFVSEGTHCKICFSLPSPQIKKQSTQGPKQGTPGSALPAGPGCCVQVWVLTAQPLLQHLEQAVAAPLQKPALSLCSGSADLPQKIRLSHAVNGFGWAPGSDELCKWKEPKSWWSIVAVAQAELCWPAGCAQLKIKSLLQVGLPELLMKL